DSPCAITCCTRGSPGFTLLCRCIIASFSIDTQRWQALWRDQFYFYLPPLSIARYFAWTVPKYILVAQLDSDFCSHVGQLIWIVDGEGPAACHIRNFGKHHRAGSFFFCTRSGIEQTDSVNLDVRFF